MVDRLWIGAGAVAMALALVPARVRAQQSPRITNQIAANHYQLGTQYFQIAQYEQAAREFQQAYELTHQPELQFNIGRALEAAGNIPVALEAYQRYLDAGAPGSNPDTIRARMDTLRQRIPPPTATGSAGTTAPPAATDTTTHTTTTTTTTAVAPPPTPRYVTERSTLGTVGPIAAAGVGAICAGLAVWQGLAASSDVGTVNSANTSATPWTPDVDRAYHSAPGEVAAAWALGVAGGVLIAAGAAWFALGVPSERHAVGATRARHGITAFVLPGATGAYVGIGGTL